MVNAVARRIYGGDPWVGGGLYMVNGVARRIYGGDPWVGELWCVAVVTASWARLGQGKRDTDPWVGGGPCMVNAVARRIYGGDSWW